MKYSILNIDMAISSTVIKSINAVIIEDDEFSKFGIKCALLAKNNEIDVKSATVSTKSGELCECVSKIKIVGETKFGIQGLRMVEEILPNIVICDIGLPDIDGIEIVEKIKIKFEDRIKILVVSGNINREVVSAAIGYGADSFFTKSTDIAKLGEAIHVTARGESWLDSNISKILISSFRRSISASTHDLTKRELVILKLIAQGLQNEEVANKLCISDGTVRSHTHNIFTKLHIKNRIQAVIQGVRMGLITMQDIQGTASENRYELNEPKMLNFVNT